MNKKVLIMILILLTSFRTKSFASQDIMVTCDSSPNCYIAPANPTYIFNEKNILPGDKFSQTITISNTRNTDCTLSMSASNITQTPVDFGQKLLTEIKQGTTTIFGGGVSTLDDFYNSPGVNFGTIKAKSTVGFDWFVTFDHATGNAYQNAETKYDFDMAFTCDDDPQDKTQRDRNPGFDHGISNSGGEEPAPAVAGITTFFAPFFPTPVEPKPEVKGVITEEEPLIEEILGLTEGKCINPWWWWLPYLLQTLIAMAILKLISKKNIKKQKRYYFGQVINSLIFAYYYFTHFCFWWDYIISLVIGIILILLTYRKIKKISQIDWS